MFGMRRLYDWVLELSRRPTAQGALALLSFAESMIFPIPPDTMLIPMCVAEPKRSYRYAFICSVASLLGGIAGYAIGMFFWEQAGPWFFEHLARFGFTEDKFAKVQGLYQDYDFWVVFTAGFTPIPYKIITISAGVFEIAFTGFVIASAVGRSARFFLIAFLLRRWGEQAQVFIDKHFNKLAIAFMVLLIGGFWAISQL